MKTRCVMIPMMLVIGLLQLPAAAQQARRAARPTRSYPPQLAGADQTEVYKTVGDVQLKLYIYFPSDHKPSEPRPAIVFFFGGGFTGGSPRQFEQQCEYFASRGMVAITCDYRVKSRHGTTPVDSVEDGRDAMRWVRTNAERLGIDPNRIVASGGSAGGLIAACVGVIDNLDEPGGRQAVSYAPNAMVLFNPALMGAEVPSRVGRERFPKKILPYHFVRKGLPPAIMFFGTDDQLLEGARQFQRAATRLGNRCELKTWEGYGHGFFNFGRNENRPFVETIEAADRFLASIGYLKGEPTVRQFLDQLNQQSRRQPK